MFPAIVEKMLSISVRLTPEEVRGHVGHAREEAQEEEGLAV